MKYLVAFLLLGLASVASSETMTIVCNYTTVATPNDGLAEVGDEGFRLTFMLDSETHKVNMIGSSGSGEVSMVNNDSGMTFVEITATGNVMTTTISDNLRSVHSRHSIMTGDLIPSQYYGQCE